MEEYRKMKTAIVGVGNLIMADEGLGVRVVGELERRGISREADLYDAGTAFFSIVSRLASYETLVIIDAVRGGKKPGTIYRFDLGNGIVDDETASGNGSFGPISVHDIGVIRALRLEELAGRVPERIVLFGAEPWRVELSLDISPPLEAVIERLADLVVAEVRNYNKTRRKGNGSQYPKAGQRAH